MTPADLEEAAAVTHRADPFGWTLRNYAGALAAGNTLTVLVADGKIAGVSAVMHVVDEAELLEIVIDPPEQGRGLGKLLLAHTLKEARRAGAARLFLEVRESNARARKMYTSFGFVQTGKRKNYYPTETGREDAVLMTAGLASLPSLN